MRFSISAGVLPTLLILIYADFYEAAAGYFIAVTVHELGHIAMVKLCKGRVEGFSIGVWGADIRYGKIRSYFFDVLISLSGGVANLLTAIVLSTLGNYTGYGALYIFSGINLLLAMFNLLPIYPLDGGNALYAVGCIISNPDTAKRLTLWVSTILSLILSVFGVYILIKTRYNGTILLCGVWLVWYSVKNLPSFSHRTNKGLLRCLLPKKNFQRFYLKSKSRHDMSAVNLVQ